MADNLLVDILADVTPWMPDSAQADEAIKDDSEMWNMYLDEVKEEDDRITHAWKDDANSIVTFTTLFSAVVGIFIIEFYKKLPSEGSGSDSGGDQTVALLRQISHQLPNSPISTNSNTAIQSSPHGTAMVWVNALWLISLVLSLTCALIATLLQQWARRYTETPKSTNMPRHRARVRSLLLVGTKLYKIPLIVEILPTLLHLSVYLFLGGLVITFHTINKTVAIAVDAAVGVSGLGYIALSILPCLDLKCPYRTPISKILWYPCHAFLSLAALCLHRCILGFYRLLNRPVPSSGQSRGFTQAVEKHSKFLTDGLEKSIVYHAVKTLNGGDSGRVTWLFNRLALGDKDKFLKFAASIPTHKFPNLILPTDRVPVSVLESLLVLLRSCVASRYTAFPNVDVHERSLVICLHAIRHIIMKNLPTTPDFMRAHFAKTSLMRSMWGDTDDSIRITSRSICALIARQVARERVGSEQMLGGAVLSWLQEVTGESANSIFAANFTMLNQMNFKSFVNAVLPNHVPQPDLSTKDATCFNETLAILLDNVIPDNRNYFTTPEWQTQLSKEVERIQLYDHQSGLEVFNKLRLVFPSLPPVTSSDAVPPPSSLISTLSSALPSPREVIPPSPGLPSPSEVLPPSPGLPSPHEVLPPSPGLPSPREVLPPSPGPPLPHEILTPSLGLSLPLEDPKLSTLPRESSPSESCSSSTSAP